MTNNIIEETKQNNDKYDTSNFGTNLSQNDLITRTVVNIEIPIKNNIQSNLETITVNFNNISRNKFKKVKNNFIRSYRRIY